ncbi:Nif3-like dinuclear metal center hexameric protein [Luteolibacter pohnpeiensis]|uniref:GTP cyclohydrolase 1 type 2 homolog n=1 Tax=Luteolibacter pohnpeiensis TaxID=454153 RepID=A0A934VQ08_9BACT|nr:Nif3-like dinuclear metal center hexameric protein [Luteolibacter pohnpeiensis]MBK1881601.1 Nif3-like dinuclear metal center hexameric protein [Luteolibacter pohnpeiensis]
MANLSEIVAFLDEELKTSSIKDYAGAVNGLQLENAGSVERVVAAVDASLPVIEAAAQGGPGLLIVHHGMFWQGVQPICGAVYRKLKSAMNAGLAIYSSHLPLDLHPELGNNVLLAKAIGLSNLAPFMEAKGVAMGMMGEWSGTREELVERVSQSVNGPVHLCPGGNDVIRSVGVVTGGAGSEVAQAKGVDAFVTGEGPHWSYPLAEELEMNVLYAGHYATETFGVKALAAKISELYGVPWTFCDHPTGL